MLQINVKKIEASNQEITPRRYKRKKSIVLRILDILGNIFIGIMAIVITMILVFVLMSLKSGGPPEFFGHQIYIVRSNSMSPTILTGSLTVVRKTDPAEVKINDIITYQREADNVSVTHRVAGIQEDDTLQFITRGDANDVDDPLPLNEDDLIGKVIAVIPYVGYILGFTKTKEGIAVMLIVPGLILLYSQVKQLIAYSKEKKKGVAEQ